MYLVSAALLPPASAIWGLVERNRWSTVVIGVALLAVAVMVYRMGQIWFIQQIWIAAMATGSSRAVGVGRVLIAVYAILALAATARSVVQIVTKFDTAPVAYLLSALAGVAYILATIALLGRGAVWYRIAWVTISFELLGVLTIGTLSLVDPALFPADTVWSFLRPRLRVHPAPAAGAPDALALAGKTGRPEAGCVMQILQLEDLPAGLGPSVVTIGKFDGVHLGHRGLVERVLSTAAERGLASVIITFDRNPLAFLRPDACPADLVSLNQKLELLGELGVDAVVVARFDESFASRTPEAFAADILADGVDARVVLAGPDFRFGARVPATSSA